MRPLALVLCAAAAVALVGCSASDVDETTRDANGQVTEGGTLGVARLEVGDCVNLGDAAAKIEGEVDAFTAVPCDQKHQGEVYLKNDAFYPDGDYPGGDAAFAQSDTACGPAFEEYVNEPYEDSALDFVSIYPTETSWSSGDRAVVCLVVTPDDDGRTLIETTGSYRG